MWALDGSAIANRKAVEMLNEWKSRHWLHSDLWLPLRQAAFFGVHALAEGKRQHLMLPAKLLSHKRPRAVPFSQLDVSLQTTLIRSYPPPFALRGLPMLIERSTDAEVGFLWRQAEAGEFLDATLFPSQQHQAASEARLLAAPSLVDEAVAWPAVSVPVLNIQETTNPFALDATLAHMHMISRAPLPLCYASGLTTVAAQFRYPSLMWLESGALEAHGLRVTCDHRDQGPHSVPVVDTVPLYHISQLSQSEQERWLARVPRFVLLNSLTTAFVLFRDRWHTTQRFGLAASLTLDDVYATNPSLPRGSPQPLLWVSPWQASEPQEEGFFVDGFTGSPLRRQRHYTASFFNAAQLGRTT